MASITPTSAITDPWKMPTEPAADLFQPEPMSKVTPQLAERTSITTNT
jgi:hypothetical protein